MEEISDRTLTRLFELPQSKIVDFFREKKLRPSNGWKELWQEEHNRSFVVAGVAQADILQEIYNEVEKALAEGTTFAEFKKNLKGKWTPEYQERRLRTVYNTNLSVAYSRGRYESMRANAQNRPYWRYKCQFLPGSRESHKALHGKIFRWDDPIWNTLFPPNDWGCQCEVEPLTAEEVSPQEISKSTRENRISVRRPLSPTAAQEVTGFIDESTGEITAPAAGWNYNPGISEYQPDMRKYNSFIGNWLDLRINAAAQNFPFIKRDTKKIDFIKELRAVNPHYDPDVKNVYSTNCQRCVVAYEARLRGLDVEALPALSMDKAKDPFADGKNWLLAFDTNKISVPQRRYYTSDGIEESFAPLIEGARMQILIKWKENGTSSHVFMAIKKNDKVEFFDPQTGATDKECRKYFLGNPTLILGAQINELKFNSTLIRDYMKEKKS